MILLVVALFRDICSVVSSFWRKTAGWEKGRVWATGSLLPSNQGPTPAGWLHLRATLPVFYPRPLTLTTATISIFPTWQLHIHSPAYNISTPLTLSIEKKKKILGGMPQDIGLVTQHPWTGELPMHAMYFPICLGCSSCQALLSLLSSAC